MLLCLDVGNSQIFGGIYQQDLLKLHFRHDSKQSFTSDQLGIFLRAVLKENDIAPDLIQAIVICSVVPNLDYSVRAACVKYFKKDPLFITHQSQLGLNIQYQNPKEVGADRLATAVAAKAHYPDQNLIVVDLGTATTFDVISRDNDYLGGVILPGIRLSMEALQSKTAKLSSVEIIKPEKIIGRATMESLQSGLFYGQIGMIRELSKKVAEEAFKNESVQLIGTGGFAHLFEAENIFNEIIPHLVLEGLRLAYALNS